MPAVKTDEQVLAEHTVVTEGGCLIWMGHRDKDGYPKVRRVSDRFGLVYLAHRLAYLLRHGSIPEGCELDHLCRNRACCNPDHIEAVPHVVNVKRGIFDPKRHRNGKKTHCLRGHELSGENLVVEVWRGITMRKCRTCRADKQRERARLKKILMRELLGLEITEV